MPGKIEEIKVVISADAKGLKQGMTAAEQTVLKAKGIVQNASGQIEASTAAWKRMRQTIVSEMEKAQQGVKKAQEKIDALKPKVFMRDSGAGEEFIRRGLSAGWNDEQIDTGLADMEAKSAASPAGQKYAAAAKQMEVYKVAVKDAAAALEYLNKKVEESAGAEAVAKAQAKAAKENAKAQAQAARARARASKASGQQNRVLLGSLTGLPVAAKAGVAAILAVVAVLSKLGSKLWEAATHNETFKSSLDQIKGNLAMAFQPIYQAVLPALQALANWLARITNYIAQVAGALFGMSWGDAQKGAKGLENNVNGVGGAAKEAQKSLAGFDELNVLSSQRSGGGGGGGGGSIFGEKIELPQWLQDLLDDPRIQEALDSIKESWASIVDSTKEIWPYLAPFATWLKDNGLDAVVRLFEAFAAALEIIAGIFTGDWDKVLDGIKKFSDAQLPKWLKDLISEWAPKLAKWVSDIPGKIGEAKTAIAQKVEDIKASIIEKWNSLVTGTREKWESIKAAVSDKIAAARDKVTFIVEIIRAWVTSKWNALKTTVTNTWNDIKSAIIDPIENARDKVQEAIDKIKGFFDFNVSWPKIKTPTVKINYDTTSWMGKAAKEFGLPGVPKFSVSWNAQGGILDRATLIGAGEAGREAILPLDRNTGWMQQLADIINGGGGGGDLYITLDLDGEPVYRTVIKRAQAERRRTGLSPLPV